MSVEQSQHESREAPSEVPGFSATRTVTPSAAHVVLAGELDLATALIADHELRRAQDEARHVLLDLRALTFIDASGLGIIIAAHLRARKLAGGLVIHQGSTNVRRLFQLTGAARALVIIDDP